MHIDAKGAGSPGFSRSRKPEQRQLVQQSTNVSLPHRYPCIFGVLPPYEYFHLDIHSIRPKSQCMLILVEGVAARTIFH